MHKSYTLPISVKGIVFENNGVWLRKNERSEWELPGGKLDEGEQPEMTVVRELKEELGIESKVIDLIHAYLYKIEISKDESKGVLMLIYFCRLINRVGEFEFIGEAGKSEFKNFSLDEVDKLNIPQFYKYAITKASQLHSENYPLRL